LGPSWQLNSAGDISPSQSLIAGRTVEFDFPPNSDVARLDYTFKFGPDGTISGRTSIYFFPLTANPLGSGETSGGTFTFTGYLIKP
jgi:hypothetical protein